MGERTEKGHLRTPAPKAFLQRAPELPGRCRAQRLGFGSASAGQTCPLKKLGDSWETPQAAVGEDTSTWTLQHRAGAAR